MFYCSPNNFLDSTNVSYISLSVIERPLTTQKETKIEIINSHNIDLISLNNIHFSCAVLGLELLLNTTFTFSSPFIKIHSCLYMY